MEHVKDLFDWARHHTKFTGSLAGATVVLWVLIYLDIVPRYDRGSYQDALAYFFPIWVVVGYVAYALLSTIAEDALENETPEEKAQYQSTLISD
jgi:hypothetical protein